MASSNRRRYVARLPTLPAIGFRLAREHDACGGLLSELHRLPSNVAQFEDAAEHDDDIQDTCKQASLSTVTGTSNSECLIGENLDYSDTNSPHKAPHNDLPHCNLDRWFSNKNSSKDDDASEIHVVDCDGAFECNLAKNNTPPNRHSKTRLTMPNATNDGLPTISTLGSEFDQKVALYGSFKIR